MIALYRALLRVQLLDAIQYRFSIVIWMFSRTIQPIVYLSVWNAIAHSQGGQVGGHTPNDFAAYYILITLVNLWASSSNMFRFSTAIENGTLSNALLKPLSPLHNEIAFLLAHRIIDTLILLPGIAILIWCFNPHFTLTTTSILLALPALAMAASIRFMVEFWVGISGFWLVRNRAFVDVYYLLLFFLSGQAAPVKLLPETVQTLAPYLPFQWMMQFPVDIALGRLTLAELERGFLFQTSWVVLALLVSRILWKRGLKAYTAVGQ